MANEITTITTNATPAIPENRNVFERFADAAGGNRIQGDLLKFAKGFWLAGQDGKDVPAGTELIANLDEMTIGWVKWQDGKPVDSVEGRVADSYAPPRRSELGDTDPTKWDLDGNMQPRDPWQLSSKVLLKATDSDKLFTYITTSRGGLNALAALAGKFGRHIKARPNEFPVVALSSDSYQHSNRAYGTIRVPLFDVVGWAPKSAFGNSDDGPTPSDDSYDAHMDAPQPFAPYDDAVDF
jgi:hypothetical protein